MPLHARKPTTTVEATVTSKGQITLPKELRNHLGIQTGSRVRFTIADRAPATIEPVLYTLEDLWRMADEGTTASERQKRFMSFAEMDAAKAERKW
jgi:antitoxin PrlF